MIDGSEIFIIELKKFNLKKLKRKLKNIYCIKKALK